MVVKMTAAEARKMGLDLSTAKPAKVRTTRRTAKGEAYHTVCKTPGCGMEFRSIAAEDRHLKETHHARFQLVLGN